VGGTVVVGGAVVVVAGAEPVVVSPNAVGAAFAFASALLWMTTAAIAITINTTASTGVTVNSRLRLRPRRAAFMSALTDRVEVCRAFRWFDLAGPMTPIPARPQ
jgi:hypothetical protein